MLVGQTSFFLPSTTADATSGLGGASLFDLELFDPDAANRDGSKRASGLSSTGAEKDPIQSANEALTREFLEWAQKTPAEKIRERILEAKGLSEEDLKALPPAEQDAIEDEIREAVKLALGVDGGKSDETSADDKATPAI